ncbi:aldose 1-epimerase family protein [Cetobacterium sp.]|uniref:aldose 1-epimerase family protein n=1 Tax=Cetobacterium sp. TaxID=2071632 RepID=UPI002FC5D063
MIKIENDKLIVLINKYGAELKSVIRKDNEIEYIWPGTSGSFKKSAPNLFPFIGNIANGEVDYPVDGERKILPMTKHGFARDLEFKLIESNQTKAIFELTPSEYTKERYPYKFSFKVIYELKDDILTHEYIVENMDSKTMYYHVGGHTAFYCNFNGDLNFENYYLNFESEKCRLYKLDERNNAFLSKDFEEIEIPEKFNLSKEKFKKDALVFDGMKSNVVNIKHANSNHGIEFIFENLPVLTLWTNVDSSEFICLEPWAGITDFTENSSKVEDKKYIQILNSFEIKRYSQNIRFY